MKKLSEKLGIKGKITLGFMVLMLLLTASGLISIYELMRIRASVSGVITKDVNNLAASQELLNTVQHVNYAMQELIFDTDNAPTALLTPPDSLTAKLLERPDELLPYLQGAPDTAKHIHELLKTMHDEVYHILSIDDRVTRRNTYLASFMPVYHLLVQDLSRMVALNRQELHKNVEDIEQNRHRIVMPCIIAVFAGVVLIVMFNYFIMHYFVNPLVKITHAVKNTVEYKSPFRVSVEAGGEMEALNDAITALVAQVKKSGKAEGA
jgi:hypothetical protein